MTRTLPSRLTRAANVAPGPVRVRFLFLELKHLAALPREREHVFGVVS